jgi:hypothetical protein
MVWNLYIHVYVHRYLHIYLLFNYFFTKMAESHSKNCVSCQISFQIFSHAAAAASLRQCFLYPVTLKWVHTKKNFPNCTKAPDGSHTLPSSEDLLHVTWRRIQRHKSRLFALKSSKPISFFLRWSGTNIVIFRIFSPNNLAKNWRSLLELLIVFFSKHWS